MIRSLKIRKTKRLLLHPRRSFSGALKSDQLTITISLVGVSPGLSTQDVRSCGAGDSLSRPTSSIKRLHWRPCDCKDYSRPYGARP